MFARLGVVLGAALGLVTGATPSIALRVDAATVPIAIAPGGHATAMVRVANSDGVSHTVRLWVEAPTGATSTDPSSWAVPTDTEITVGAHGTVPVSIAVDPPTGLPAGSVDVVVAGQRIDGGADPVATVAVPITVTGTVSALVRVTSVTTSLRHGHSVLVVSVRNDGGRGADVSGSVTVAPSGVRTPVHVRVDARSGTSFEVPWTPQRDVAATAEVALVSGTETVTWSGALEAPIGTTVAEASTVPSPSGDGGSTSWPTLLVVAALLAATGWLGFEIMAGRRGHPPVVAPPVDVPQTVRATGVDQLAPLIDAIGQLSAALGGRSLTDPRVLPFTENEAAVRAAVFAATAEGLGVSVDQLDRWLPDDLRARAGVATTGNADHDALLVRNRALELQVEILRRAMGDRADQPRALPTRSTNNAS